MTGVGISLQTEATTVFDVFYLASLSLSLGSLGHPLFFSAIFLSPLLIGLSLWQSFITPLRAMMGGMGGGELTNAQQQGGSKKRR